MKINSIQEKFKKLDGGTLKIIAMVSMLLDHVNKALLYPFLNSEALRVVSDLFAVLGRIAFPVFCYMIVEGFFKTKSRKKYLLNLLLLGILSEIPFDMFTSCTFFDANWNNVIFTFCLVLITIWIIDALKEKFKNSKIIWYAISFVIVSVMCLLSMLLGLDYEHHAVLIGYFFYVFYEKPVFAIPFCFASMYKEPWALLGFLLVLTYNGKRGKQNKLFNYAFYPVHMLILGVLRMTLF